MRFSLKDILPLRRPPSVLISKALVAACLALILAAWFLATRCPAEGRLVSPALLPSPLEVLGGFPSLAANGELLQAVVATLRRVLAGFLLAVVVGVPAGMAAGAWRPVGS